MKRPKELLLELNNVSTLVELSGVFESLASLRIAQIKNQVLQSQEFFTELWNIYNQIRVDDDFGFGRSQISEVVSEKELFIVITAEGGFSGDIDQKLIDWMLQTYDKDKHDIIIIGHHGAIQLAQRRIGIKRYFKLPSKDQNINVAPIIAEVQKYRSTTAWYQTYVSLMVQDVKRISLHNAVAQRGGGEKVEISEIITEENYIFEPSTRHVIDHLERSMLSIALSQIILESKLAQYASRFRAMSVANDRAKDSQHELKLGYNRARRSLQDERLKEIVSAMRKVNA